MTTKHDSSIPDNSGVELNPQRILDAVLLHVCGSDEIFDDNSAAWHAYSIVNACLIIHQNEETLARYRQGRR